MTEFDLIENYFMRSTYNGDDAAIVETPPGHQLVTSIDTSVEGRHFLQSTPPHAIGYKALAVSISDMAAMGAAPSTCLLSLCIPTTDAHWLSEFSNGFFQVANQFSIELIGGDVTEGPCVISTTIFGTAPHGTLLKRSGAQVGDAIFVSGILGNAGAALQNPTLDQTPLNYPQPRVALGIALRDIATSCIDISDGLLQDLGHILKASHVGADVQVDAIPHTSSLECALTAGDDYELCFTSPHQNLDLPVTKIGVVTNTHELRLLDQNGQQLPFQDKGYQHFLS